MIISGISSRQCRKILSCGLLVLGVVDASQSLRNGESDLAQRKFYILSTIRQPLLPSKSECRTVDSAISLQLPISWQIHWQRFQGRSSVYGIIYTGSLFAGIRRSGEQTKEAYQEVVRIRRKSCDFELAKPQDFVLRTENTETKARHFCTDLNGR